MKVVAFIMLYLIPLYLIEAKNVGVEKGQRRNYHSIFVNSAGGKESPIVIGKSASQRCFKGLKDKKMPHSLQLYFANPKA